MRAAFPSWTVVSRAARLRLAMPTLLVVLLVAALCDLPGPDQEPWHTLLYGLTLCMGAVLALRVAQGQALRFSRIWLVWLLFGQFFGTRVSFPFTRFDMFTAPAAAEQTHYLYRAHHASGAERAFEPGSLLPSLGYSRLLLGLHNHVAALESIRAQASSPELLSEAEQRVRELLQATLLVYNRQPSADPIRRLDVYRAHWHSAVPDRLQERERIFQVSLP